MITTDINTAFADRFGMDIGVVLTNWGIDRNIVMSAVSDPVNPVEDAVIVELAETLRSTKLSAPVISEVVDSINSGTLSLVDANTGLYWASQDARLAA